MLESIEIRKAENGFILVIHDSDDDREYIYDTERKLFKALREQLNVKPDKGD